MAYKNKLCRKKVNPKYIHTPWINVFPIRCVIIWGLLKGGIFSLKTHSLQIRINSGWLEISNR